MATGFGDSPEIASRLAALHGFQGATDIGAVSIHEVPVGFQIILNDLADGSARLRSSCYLVAPEGRILSRGAELPAQKEFNPSRTIGQHRNVALPRGLEEIISAVEKKLSQDDG